MADLIQEEELREEAPLTPEEIQEQIIAELEGEQASEASAPSESSESLEEGQEPQEDSEGEEGQEQEEEAQEDIEELKEQKKALEAELVALREALDLRLKEDLDALSKEDQALVEELSEGDALEKARVLSKLLASGKISKSSHSPKQDLRANRPGVELPPRTPEEAAQQVLKAIEARAL